MAVGQVINLLRGSVAVEVTGAFPERFLNLCAQERIAFWGVEWPEGNTLRMVVTWAHRPLLDDLAGRAGCQVTDLTRRGVPSFLLRFRRRYAFLVGLALAMAAVCFLSQFVLVVEVEGNEQLPAQVILTELQRQGLRPGVYGPSLALREISTQALLALDDLSWMTVNLHGIRAQVVVREKLPQPEVVDESVHGDVVAEAAGLVTRIEAWSGDAQVQVGDTVLPGDVLIRGQVQMDPPLVGDTLPPPLEVRAQGLVEGRTWRTLTAAIPLTAQVKVYTGDKRSLWSAAVLGQRVNFFQNSGISYAKYDKISQTWNLTLPGGTVLPFSLRRETLRAYDTQTWELDPAAAQAMLEEQLLRRLDALLGESGEEVSHSFEAQVEGGTLTVTLTAECVETLGRFVPTS